VPAWRAEWTRWGGGGRWWPNAHSQAAAHAQRPQDGARHPEEWHLGNTGEQPCTAHEQPARTEPHQVHVEIPGGEEPGVSSTAGPASEAHASEAPNPQPHSLRCLRKCPVRE
jgi:hypothetical protein